MNEQPADAARAIIRAHAALSRPAEQQGSDESRQPVPFDPDDPDEAEFLGIEFRGIEQTEGSDESGEGLTEAALSVWSNACNAHCSEEDRVHEPECLLAAGLYHDLAHAAAARRDADKLRDRLAAVEALADEWERPGPKVQGTPEDAAAALRAALANPSAAQGEGEAAMTSQETARWLRARADSLATETPSRPARREEPPVSACKECDTRRSALTRAKDDLVRVARRCARRQTSHNVEAVMDAKVGVAKAQEFAAYHARTEHQGGAA